MPESKVSPVHAYVIFRSDRRRSSDRESPRTTTVDLGDTREAQLRALHFSDNELNDLKPSHTVVARIAATRREPRYRARARALFN